MDVRLLLPALAVFVNGHSWLECTDYKSDITNNNFDYSNCEGFARNFDEFYVGQFGLDRGFNYLPGDGPLCRDEKIYTDEFPMAEYSTGETVRLVWPAKNHVAAECTNPFIPETFLRLYMSCDGTDPELTDAFLVEDFKDKGGFQNCPDFCSNMDKAVCFQDFEVPSSASGECTFVWAWAFNNEDELYTACFEAVVDGDDSAPEKPEAPKPPTQPSDEEEDDDKPEEPGQCCVASRLYAQCGGKQYKGDTCCPCGTKCEKANDYYSQCRPI